MYIPNTDKYPFPEDTAKHYIKVNEIHHFIFDKNYPYVDHSKGFAFRRFWVRILLKTIVFPMSNIRMGLKVKGKSNLKKNKELIKSGAITISNHVHFWDYICIMKVLHNYEWPYLLAWDKNVNGDSGTLVRMVGGLPIPLNDNEATIEFNKSLNKLLKEKNILHIYPEGSMWEYYVPIRPFKRGAFSIACKNNVPIIPMAFTYRKPGWIRRKIFRQNALFMLNIGSPIYPNGELEQAAQIDDLTVRAHQAVCELAGIDNNKYSPIYDHSKKMN